MHRTICSQIIKNILVPHFKQKLTEDMGEHGFSLLIEESTDISDIKYLGFAKIYFSEEENQIVTTYLDLQPLENGTADSIDDAPIKTVTKRKLKKVLLFVI